MRITAIIPTKNRFKDLQIAIHSVLIQETLPDQLIIVDQSASEEGRAAIQSMVQQARVSTELVYVYDTSITGLVDAKRVGVTHSTGEVICFLEDDIILEPSYFRVMQDSFNADPEMMGCCGVVTNLPDISSRYVRFFHLFHRGVFHDARVGVHGWTASDDIRLIPSNYLSGGTSAYRKVVFEKIPFDLANGFFMLEDIDFSTRAARAFGPQHFFINTAARLRHMMSPLNRAQLKARYQRKLREFICFYKKNRKQKSATRHLSWLLLGLTVEAMKVSIKNLSFDPLVGLFSGIAAGFKWSIKPE